MSVQLDDKIHLEVNFETYITRKLAMLEGDGWRISDNDAGFDPSAALYLPDFIEYVTATAPDKVAKMQKAFGGNWENNLKLQLVKALETRGTVLTLREGFQS